MDYFVGSLEDYIVGRSVVRKDCVRGFLREEWVLGSGLEVMWVVF